RAVPLRPGPQGLRRHRPQRHLSRLVHGRGGVLSDVYSPTVDNTNVETLQYVVTDGATFTDLQSRDTTYTVRSTDRGGMACQVTSTAKSGRYRIETEYVTDPARDSVVMETRRQALRGS